MLSDKEVNRLFAAFPFIIDMAAGNEIFELNPGKKDISQALAECPLGIDDIYDASARLDRFAPYIAKVFPETAADKGIIESPLLDIPEMKKALEAQYSVNIGGRLLLKADSHLAVSGSVKARGGIYEVLKFAEDVALSSGMLTLDDDYSVLDSDRFRNLFSQYSVAVGSTGNLGLSIGIISAKLGFRVTVHMSADARQWKKDMLRSKGVTVIEYASDYSAAVEAGRRLAEADEKCHFVDDENSRTLFLGYSVAALRLKKQLKDMNIGNDAPLNVYIPCGVGGAPGGIAFGLKQVFGSRMHCYFVEPVSSCCFALGLLSGLDSRISVRDIGLDNITSADGLAVARPSGFVGGVIRPFLDGCCTVKDDELFRMLALLADSEHIYLEPSALAGLYALVSGLKKGCIENDPDAVHIAWATGGSLVPVPEMKEFYDTGKQLLA